ncbi:DUF6265 family protein [Flavobacterium litorale]|uniref:DUF6265 domain-containing protein n=1 Tax=Flavobacterium litorale TaxID=2856519 RepID=A0ABX8V3Q6_9FLAO|nr:DUF6265 family protein [Flavobacterium litorale]QYJ67430.1 hypothetical protein K1I41_07630 [Flavobacterium litorale]
MKKRMLLCTAILCSVIACKNKDIRGLVATAKTKTYKQINKANWLLGNWGNTSPKGTLTENWEKINDSVYNGQSFFVIEKDTVFSERIILKETSGKLAYIVNVAGQNGERPVWFEMTAIDDNKIVFENSKHDFPTKIVYNNIGNDSLVAEISGMKKGKPASQKFAMIRIK